jgi:hypothetical protein
MPSLEIRGRYGNAEDDVRPSPRLFRQVLDEVVELVAQLVLARSLAADVVEQLVHQDQCRPIGEERSDRVAARCDSLGVVLGDDI